MLEKGTTINLDDLVSTNTDELYIDDNDNIRYYGSNPNNYVSFNNELWRILGIIDGKMKIIRNNALTPVTTDNGVTIGKSDDGFYWNKVQQSGKNNNNWEDSTLQTYLNGTYYNSLNSTYKNMISPSTYYLGGATNSNRQTLTASGYYNAERDSSQVYSGNPASTRQYIGLMYPSDYGYAAGESCLSTALWNYDSSCKNTDYLFSRTTEWLQAPYVSNPSYAAALTSSGLVYVYGSLVHINSNDVRPVLYLNSNVKITGGDGSQSNPFKLGNGISTSTLEKPTFKETETSNGKTVTITYPSGCGSSLTCTYKKDNGTAVNVTSTTVNVSFTESGSLVATVSDGINKVSSSYNIDVTLSVSIGGVKVELATSGDGMYKDKYENNRYIYRGHYPNNYLTFNGETAGWRIMSKEADGTYKIVKDNSIGSMAFDTEGHRDNTSDVLNYCRYASAESMGKKGCNAWASTYNMNTTQFVLGAFSGYVYEDAELNTYLNTTYYNMINTNKDKIVNHKFNVGGIEYNSSPSMAEQIALESKYTWYGKIAIISSSDFLKVNLDEENCGTFGNYNKKGWGCASNNYLAFPVANKFRFFSTITPTTELASYALWSPMQSQKTSIYFAYANQQLDIYPTMYISSNIKLSGTGTESNPFVITN